MQSVHHIYKMESANFHHHQQQDHQLVDSSFSWCPNPILNGRNDKINSRNLDTDTNSNMIQDLGFLYNSMGYPLENYVTQELQCLARFKDEFSVAESYPKFLELLSCSPTSSIEDLHLQPYSSYMKNDDHHQISYSNSNQDFSLANFSAGCQIKGGQIISIFSLNQSTTSSSSSSSSSCSAISSSPFDMNCSPALDLFGPPRFDGNFSHHSSNVCNLGVRSYCFDGMHQPNHRPSVCRNKISPVSNTGSTDQSTKRPASKNIQPVPLKKPKSEPRSSSAPFQVRKEKLGDRIAAIQQLVAPFGKTDTASVLMEAIGYIKFLQSQVETLSLPYMKSTNKIGGTSSQRGQMEDGNTAAIRDLCSRGLCLVSRSCLTYVTDECEGIWRAP